MSLGSRVILSSSVLASIGTIGYVHYKQKIDKDRMHEGVVRDVERQRRRKAENLYILQQQMELTKQMKKEQASDPLDVT